MSDPSASMHLLAWEVEINYMTCVVFAPTAAKARWIAVRGYWNAGYGRGPGTWPNPKERRAPHLDHCSLADQGPKCWMPEHAQAMTG